MVNYRRDDDKNKGKHGRKEAVDGHRQNPDYGNFCFVCGQPLKTRKRTVHWLSHTVRWLLERLCPGCRERTGNGKPPEKNE